MPKNKLIKTLEYHFHRDNHDNNYVSDDSDGEGLNRSFAGDPVSELIEELLENGKLKKCRDYKLK